MTKAKQTAVEKYPYGLFEGKVGDFMRAACAVGYMQAEKDLALTPGDMSIIDEICTEMRQHTDWPLKGQDAFYEEVLRMFNSQREKK